MSLYQVRWALRSELMLDKSRANICHELEDFFLLVMFDSRTLLRLCQGPCSRHLAFVISSSQQRQRIYLISKEMMTLAKVPVCSSQDVNPDPSVPKPVFPSTHLNSVQCFPSTLQGGYYVVNKNEVIGILLFFSS